MAFIERSAILLWLAIPHGLTAVERVPEARVRVEEVGPVLRSHAVAPADVLLQDEFQHERASHGINRRPADSRRAFTWAPNEGMGVSGALRAAMLPGRDNAATIKVHFGHNPANASEQAADKCVEIWWRVYLRHDAAAAVEDATLAGLVGIAGSSGPRAMEARVSSGTGGALKISAHSPSARGSMRGSTSTRGTAETIGTSLGTSQVLNRSEAGRWICIESRVRLNDPGETNGAFDLWVDGRRECALTGLRWNGGGGSIHMNALILENGVSRKTGRRASIWLDNLVVAAAEIGPVVVSAGCSAYRTKAAVDWWQVQVGAGPNARQAVWTSAPLRGSVERCALDAPFRTGGVYWLRTRDRMQNGGWSRWSAWHSPFAIL